MFHIAHDLLSIDFPASLGATGPLLMIGGAVYVDDCTGAAPTYQHIRKKKSGAKPIKV